MRKRRGKKFTKITPETRPPQAPPKEGMCLAGYGMLGVREMERGRFKAKSSWVNSQRSKLWWLEILEFGISLV